MTVKPELDKTWGVGRNRVDGGEVEKGVLTGAWLRLGEARTEEERVAGAWLVSHEASPQRRSDKAVVTEGAKPQIGFPEGTTSGSTLTWGQIPDHTKRSTASYNRVQSLGSNGESRRLYRWENVAIVVGREEPYDGCHD